MPVTLEARALNIVSELRNYDHWDFAAQLRNYHWHRARREPLNCLRLRLLPSDRSLTLCYLLVMRLAELSTGHFRYCFVHVCD